MISAVYAKEMLEALRDRRTLLMMIVLPALFMPLTTLGVPFLAQRQAHQIQTVIPKVAIVGGSPALSRLALRTKLLAPVRVKNATAALRAGQVLAVLEIPAGFERIVARNGQVHVGILYNASDPASMAARVRAGRAALALQRGRRRGPPGWPGASIRGRSSR